MAKQYYWAVRPISHRGANTRIEKAETAWLAANLAFGKGHTFREPWLEAKNLGSRVAVIQSDKQRIALLRDPSGWEKVR